MSRKPYKTGVGRKSNCGQQIPKFFTSVKVLDLWSTPNIFVHFPAQRYAFSCCRAVFSYACKSFFMGEEGATGSEVKVVSRPASSPRRYLAAVAAP